jgi:hypothetical protein
MTADVKPDELCGAVERMHNCSARLAQSVPVSETFGGNIVWEGVVHVFDLTGHPKATRAYAWSSPIEGSDKRRFGYVGGGGREGGYRRGAQGTAIMNRAVVGDVLAIGSDFDPTNRHCRFET